MNNFKLTTNYGYEVEWGVNRFPDGQVQVWISNNALLGSLKLKCRLTSPEDMHILDQLTQLIQGVPVTILYMYGSRCDKDTQGDRVVYNQHNELCKRLTYKDEVLMPHGVFPYMCTVKEIAPPDPGIDNYDVIVFPDASAERRFKKYLFDSKPTVTCSKGRNQITGEITDYVVPFVEAPKLIGKRALVVDDICDGGATFKALANQLYSVVSELDLYVVHGIFSKPSLELYLSGYSHIYTTNSYKEWAPDDHLTVFDVWK